MTFIAGDNLRGEAAFGLRDQVIRCHALTADQDGKVRFHIAVRREIAPEGSPVLEVEQGIRLVITLRKRRPSEGWDPVHSISL